METIEQILTPTTPEGEPAKAPATVWQYINLILKQKWRIFFISVFVACITAFYISSVTPLYRATATLLIEAEQAKAVAIDAVQGLDSKRKEYYLTQFEILKSHSIAEAVFEKLNLQDHPEFQQNRSAVGAFIEDNIKSPIKSIINGTLELVGLAPSTSNAITPDGDENISIEEQEKRYLIKKFSDRLEIAPIRKTQLVTVSFVSEDPELAALVANTIGETYVSQDVAVKSAINQNAAQWLTKRLDDLRQTLDKSEEKLQAYRKKENIIDLQTKTGSGLTGLVSSELEQTSRQLIEAKNEVTQLESIMRVVNEYGVNNIDRLESIAEITSHPVIQNLKRIKVEANLNVSELSQVFGPKHPTLVAAKSELNTVNKQLKTQIYKLISGLEKQLNTKKSNVAALQREYQRIQSRFQNVIGKDNTYQKLVRDVESNRKLYNTFLSRSKETELTSDFNAAVARFTDLAYPPSRPKSVSKTLVVILSFIITAGLCIGMIVLFEKFNDSFSSVADIEHRLGLTVLGILPQVARKKGQDLPVHHFFEENGRKFAESVRTLRTSLLLGQGEDETKQQVIAVISSQPNEGKSTMSTNFAFSLGQIEKTILIDADLRKPSLAKNFGIPKDHPGLADVIAGTAKLSDCLYTDRVSGIKILPSGPIPTNPQELLSSIRFNQLLQNLKRSYDRIIIDTPPIQAVSDCLVIATQTDAVIYVIKSEETKVRLVQTGVKRLRKIKANIAGVVMNHVNTDGLADADYYYGYYSDNEYGETSLNRS